MVNKWLDRKEYPFKSNFIQLPMGKMHYVDEGTGEPVIMVHGNPGWSFEFRNVIKGLGENFRCVVPDHIGFGLSDKPSGWDYRPQSHAANFERLMNHLSLTNLTLLVNDWGGPIALSYAIKYPDKIKRIVILNTWLWDVSREKHFRRFSSFMGGPLGRFLIRNFNFFGKVVVKKAMGNPVGLSKNIHAHYYKHLRKPEDRKGCYVFPKEIIASADWLATLWKQHERIRQIPATIIWGMKDIAFREKDLEYWRAHWPEAEVIKLPQAGHFPQEEAPEIIIKTFLNT